MGPGLPASLSRSHRWPRPSTDHRHTFIHKIHHPREGIFPSSSSALPDFLDCWLVLELPGQLGQQARCCLCFTAIQRDSFLVFPGKAHDINTTYIENSKNSTHTHKLVEPINKFSKIAEHKINIQKLVTFLYTNNEILERESKKISF